MQEYEYELYHHGIKGMKWGIRRTRKQLGRKVSRGLKKIRKKLDEASEARKAKVEAKKEANKSIKELTDAELRNRANRLRLEKDVLDLERQIGSLSPRKVSTGEKFAKMVTDKLAPALIDVGKEYVTKSLKDYMGLSNKDVDPLKELEESTRELRLKKESATYKKEIARVDDFFAERESKAANKDNNENKNSTDSYAKMVSRGEGEVQAALRKMEKTNLPLNRTLPMLRMNESIIMKLMLDLKKCGTRE